MLEGFAENLRKIRTEKNLTQEQLGGRANINYKYLGELERNIKSPSGVVIHKLSRALGVPVCELMPTDGCPISKREFFKELEVLVEGKDEDELKRVIRALEVLMELLPVVKRQGRQDAKE
ncbi:MAG: helix-turn-helix transcriptional regulator [Nitrospirae bacterium]|nr:helix-turn-helix transcriptional regulator [Nitrospirota bacterium]